MRLILTAALAAFLLAGAAQAGSARPQGACAYTFDEAVRMTLDANEGAVAHEMTAAEAQRFAAARGVEHMDRATWFESPAYPVVYVLIGAGGCAIGSGEWPRARLLEIISGSSPETE